MKSIFHRVYGELWMINLDEVFQLLIEKNKRPNANEVLDLRSKSFKLTLRIQMT